MSYTFDINKTLYPPYIQYSPASHVRGYFTNVIGAQNFGSYVYTSNDFFTVFSKVFGSANIQNFIKSFRYYPFDLSEYMDLTRYANYETIGSKEVGAVFGTTTPVYKVYGTANNNVFLMGDFDVPFFGGVDSYLSYEPYTKIQLYLPFYNSLIDIDAKRISGKKLYVHGVLDYYEGDMIYVLTTDNSEYIGSYKAHITIDLPLMSDDITSYMKQLVSNMSQALSGMSDKNVGGIVSGVFGTATAKIPYNNVTNGSLDSLKGYYAPTEPVLLIYRPKIKYSLTDTNYNHLIGVPCKKMGQLSEFGGYTKVGAIHDISIAGATSSEIMEISQLLQEGVILNAQQATFSVSYIGSNISYSIIRDKVDYGYPYTNTFTITTGYQLDNMTITMGGVDITSTALSGNTINIAEVTGNIVIRAEVSKTPVYHTIMYSGLIGATLSNTSIQVLEGSRYETTITPSYSLGYIGGSYVPSVTMDGVSVTQGVNTFSISIPNVQGDIAISGTYPDLSTTASIWTLKTTSLALPSNAIVTSLLCRLNAGTTQIESTSGVTIDNSEDVVFNNNFLTFTGNVVGGVSGKDIGVNTALMISYMDSGVITDIGTMTRLEILTTSSWTSYADLLEWLDTNFTNA